MADKDKQMRSSQKNCVATRAEELHCKRPPRVQLVIAPLAIATLLSLGIASQLAGAEQPDVQIPTPDRKPAFAIEAEAVIGFPAARRITVDLGRLPTDRPVKLTLHLVNQSGATLNYNEVQVSCGCIQAKLEHAVIDQGKEGICHLTINTASKQRSQVFSTPIKLFNSRAPHEHSVITLEGYLQGYLGFIEPYVTAELRQGHELTEVVIPFAATSPVVGGSVEVSQSPFVGKQRIEPAKGKDDIWNLHLSVKASAIAKEGMTISLTLDDHATVRQSQCTLMLCHDRAISINPKTIRLTQDDDSFTFSGSCILTIRNAVPVPSLDAGKKTSPVNSKTLGLPAVSAIFGGRSASISVRRMSDEHFRVSIQIQGEVLEDLEVQGASKELSMDWSISSKDGACQISTPVAITQRG